MVSVNLPCATISVTLAALLMGCAPSTEPSSDQAGATADQSGATLADRIYTGGNILTVDENFSVAEAIAIRDDRVLAVGSNAEIRALADASTATTELDGRTVIPGLIDNHMHFVRATRDWYRHVRWDNVTSRAQALQMVAQRARTLPEGEWVVVIGGWNFAQFEDNGELFSVAELDDVAPITPVYIQEGYRRGFANSSALTAAGVDSSTAFQGRGAVVKNDTGALTGEFVGGAMTLVTAATPPVSSDVWDASLQQTIADMHRFGLTTIYDVGGNTVTAEHYDAVKRAAAADDLTMRVFYSLNGQSGIGPSADEIITALSSNTPDLDNLKFARFGWGEATYPPMRAAPWQISQADLEHYTAIALTAAEHGWQMNEHSMRDVKISAMLDVFEAVDSQRSIADLRWTIAHTNGISDQSIARANALGTVFATHSSSRMSTPEAVAAGANAPPFRNIAESGGIWGLGSDATTVSSPNPFHNMGWVVSGLSPTGEHILDQTMSREAVLTAHTRTNAYLLFREDHLGSLEAGKLADFAVLNRNYMTVPADEIKDLRSVMTVVGGEVVFSEL